MPYRDTARLIDTGQALEIYADLVGDITMLGGVNACFAFARVHALAEGEEHHINLRLILPMTAIGPGLLMLGRKLGGRLALPSHVLSAGLPVQ